MLRQQSIIVDAARYPYTVDLEQFVRKRFGPVSYSVLMLRRDVVERALERIREAIERGAISVGNGNPEVETLAFYLGLLLVTLLNDRWAVSRYALAEAERSYQSLLHESDETIVAIAQKIGVGLEYHEKGLKQPYAVTSTGIVLYREYHYSISIFEYARVARRLVGDPKWKPTNLPVKDGRVYLDKDMAVRLLKEAIMEYIERLASTFSEVKPEKLPDELIQVLEEARRVLNEARPKPKVMRAGGKIRVKLPKGFVVEEAFPPCMADIIDRARRGEHLSHHERFAIATFLLNLGVDIDRVVDVFRNLPDFNEKVARYQVEHLAGLRGSGKKYRTYSCEKMRSLGICKGECETRSPIQAYYRNVSRLVKEGKLRLESISGSGEAGEPGVGGVEPQEEGGGTGGGNEHEDEV
ncbi:DNA primase, large subunit [Pyrolobus fumarii 1A]|uniref:DNA primase large subunit PriL n=1 Tax=Pyrolobus fumarii (strain DSM 11204 / 1A) TaxID=694429 RepID=G0ECK0_PYRF1|nr:DNA primase large subunit [Pyrolobus fumarii]AEM39570.1 DNA primase, large subunit [Pyrolobus fumarii 1A]